VRKITIMLPEIKLMGISVRTNNADEIAIENGKIVPCLQRYFGEQLAEKIPFRKKAGSTLCVYTGYESDHTGAYTYFVGEEVSSHDQVPEGLEKLVIPPQTYVKFTNGPGPMPAVVREPWFKIWQMDENALGGKRRFLADFEVYDERAQNPAQAIVDICIGIE
jgi:predicted transcriptional regulator YdeE